MVRMLFKSAGLTDVEDIEALQFHNEQIHCILKTTNDSKKKSNVARMISDHMSNLCTLQWRNHQFHPITQELCRPKTISQYSKNNSHIGGMKRGKVHRKNMRENTVYFSRILKRLGNKKVSHQLEEAFLKWLDNNNMVIQSPLASDTLLVSDPDNPGNEKRMNKILLQIPVRELYNDLVSTDPLNRSSRSPLLQW
jgi:hypothetical protein